jgi:hypothetical protein
MTVLIICERFTGQGIVNFFSLLDYWLALVMKSLDWERSDPIFHHLLRNKKDQDD